jgi:hypothetical protein
MLLITCLDDDDDCDGDDSDDDLDHDYTDIYLSNRSREGDDHQLIRSLLNPVRPYPWVECSSSPAIKDGGGDVNSSKDRVEGNNDNFQTNNNPSSKGEGGNKFSNSTCYKVGGLVLRE